MTLITAPQPGFADYLRAIAIAEAAHEARYRTLRRGGAGSGAVAGRFKWEEAPPPTRRRRLAS